MPRSDGSASHLVRRDLLTPDEVMRLPAGAVLLLRQGAAPILASKVSYFAYTGVPGLFDQPSASGLMNAASRTPAPRSYVRSFTASYVESAPAGCRIPHPLCSRSLSPLCTAEPACCLLAAKDGSDVRERWFL